MHFLPPVQAIQRVRLQQILKDLSCRKVFSLLEHLRAISNANESDDTILQILHHKTEYFWLFESLEVQNSLQSVASNWSRILLRHYSYTQRHRKHFLRNTSPYLEGDQILWQIYLRDYMALQLNEKRHLYINLTNYLDWSKVQKSLCDNEMISKIFFPLAEELLSERLCPLAFVLESLKLVLFLNPRHGAALVLYSQLIKKLGEESIACDLLENSVRRGIVHSGVLEAFLEAIVEQARTDTLEEFARRLAGRSIAHLDGNFYIRMAEILHHAGLASASLFYSLKAIAHGGQQTKFQLVLARTLLTLGEFEVAQEFMNEHHISSNLVFFIMPELMTHLTYRYAALDHEQPLVDPCLILPPELDRRGKVSIEFRHSNTRETCIFFPDTWGPYRILYNSDQLKIEKVDLPSRIRDSSVSPRIIEYAGLKMELTTKWLRSITPFHFTKVAKT